MVLGGFCSENHCHIRGPAFAACCAACNASSFVASLGRDAQPVVFFHHTPKTGGSTIECATQGLAGWINLGHAVPGPAVVEACVARHCARAFGPSPRVLRVVSVRNPFTYYESQYYFARAALRRMTRPFVSALAYGLFRRRQTHLVLDNNFTRFMHAVLTDDTWRREVGLDETLGRICGRPCRPDAVLHTEQLAADFAAVLRMAGRPPRPLPTAGVNSVTAQDREPPVVWTDALRGAVRAHDASVFEQFRYR